MTTDYIDSTLLAPNRSRRYANVGPTVLRGATPPSFGTTSKFERNVRRLQEFALAPRGWNGYDAEPISPEVISATLTILLDFAAAQPFPSPLADGGIQLDWHRASGGAELEVEIRPNCFTLIYGDDREEVVEGLPPAIKLIRKWLRG